MRAQATPGRRSSSSSNRSGSQAGDPAHARYAQNTHGHDGGRAEGDQRAHPPGLRPQPPLPVAQPRLAPVEEPLRPLELGRPDRDADEDDEPSGSGRRHGDETDDDDHQPQHGHDGPVCAVGGRVRPDPPTPLPPVVVRVQGDVVVEVLGGLALGVARAARSRVQVLGARAAKTLAARAVTGPGVSSRSSTAWTASTSRVELVMKTSSAVSQDVEREGAAPPRPARPPGTTRGSARG